MYYDNKIWVGNTDAGEKVSLLPKMANRHGLIAGATGTGKTVTLKVLAESFSDMGVPVFIADVKGDVAGLAVTGTDSEDMQSRIARFGLMEAGFHYEGYPVTLWDIYGEKGIPLRTTVSEMGPLLLSRILDLNDLQSDLLTIAFKIADTGIDESGPMLLVDTKDLKSLLNYIDEHSADFAADYGKISSASIGVIIRALVALEAAGGDKFFADPALNVADWLTTGEAGKGMIHILDSSMLINNSKLYSTFLLWLLAELFEMMPEVGDLEKPKIVFFFDEAHLLFNDAPKALLEKIEQVVKLIRSKGVGIYFCTQNPRDIPDSVSAQLGNKIEHGLRAYTPAEQKVVKAVSESYRENPDMDTYETILNLGTGEAVISFLQEDGTPSMAQKVNVLPPKSSFGALDDATRDQKVKESLLYSKYAQAQDSDSAYEFLQRKGLADQAEKDAAAAQAVADKEAAAAEKAAAKEAEKAEKAALKEAEKEEKARKRAIKNVGSSMAGTVGRELGKGVGGLVGGKFGKTLGGNTGASLFRGLFQTLYRK